MVLLLGSCTTKNPGSDASLDSGTKAELDKVDKQSTVTSLSATDTLGRSFDSVNSMDKKKYVGMFYFTWLGQHGTTGLYDISKLTDKQLWNGDNQDSPNGQFHFFTEPLYGYYNSEDEWVIRKHIELLTLAGIDYIALDVTNAITYNNVYTKLFDIMQKYYDDGWAVPKFLFYCNTSSAMTITTLYNSIYSKGKFKDLWFAPEGKPWIVGSRDDGSYLTLSADIQSFFQIKDSQWPNKEKLANALPWLSWDEKPYNHNGIMCVNVASQTNGAFSESITASRDYNKGRGYLSTDAQNNKDRVLEGSFIKEQWDYVLAQDDVYMVFVTGWNEWAAQKQWGTTPVKSETHSYFVDTVNVEFSRDIEMMKGGYADNFYLQMADYIRQFKGTDTDTTTTPVSKTIDISGDINQWSGINAVYYDFVGDTKERNSAGMIPSIVYTDKTGRNDIEQIRMTADSENLYFLIACSQDITAYNGEKNWMNLFLNIDGQDKGKWNGYQYILNRTVKDGKTSVEQLNADGSSVAISEAQMAVSGKYMQIKLPKTVIGIASDSYTIRFKVADNVTNYQDIMDYYVTGDSAPIGRLNYTFEVK